MDHAVATRNARKAVTTPEPRIRITCRNCGEGEMRNADAAPDVRGAVSSIPADQAPPAADLDPCLPP
jgi:hypothetical protein